MSESVPWDWLRTCRTCNKPHAWRWSCKANHHIEGKYFGQQHDGCSGGTWADPTDGHSAQGRLPSAAVEQSQREYDDDEGR
jgi:hypothetical protein